MRVGLVGSAKLKALAERLPDFAPIVEDQLGAPAQRP
jgi:hypothetical protein